MKLKLFALQVHISRIPHILVPRKNRVTQNSCMYINAFLLTDVRNSPNCNKLNLENWKAFRLLHIYFIIGKGKLKFYERTNSSGDGIILVKLRIFEIHFCGNGNQLSYIAKWLTPPFVVGRKKSWRVCKGQIMSECILWNHRFSKIPPKNLINFCPGRLYRLGMLVWVNMYCI